MKFETYNAVMDVLSEQLKEAFEGLVDTVTEFQWEYMDDVLEEYKKTVGDDKAKAVCAEILEYAVKESTSGSVVVYVKDKETADKVDEIIWEEIGRYMLDAPEIYEENGEYAIDCMFAGYYVPGWDGWLDV